MHFNLPWSKLSMYIPGQRTALWGQHGERCCMCGMCVWSGEGTAWWGTAVVATVTAAKGKVVNKHPCIYTHANRTPTLSHTKWTCSIFRTKWKLISNASHHRPNRWDSCIHNLVHFFYAQIMPQHTPPTHSASVSRNWSPFECTMARMRAIPGGRGGGKGDWLNWGMLLFQYVFSAMSQVLLQLEACFGH